MNERIQRALDGELPEIELTAAEAEERDALERMLSGVVRSVPARPLPALGDLVVARIAAEEASGRARPERALWPARLLGWFWRPRPLVIAWRPAYAAMALAGILAVGTVSTRPGAAPPVEARSVLVQFRLDAPQANTVRLAGDFTGWKPEYTLVRSGETWTVVVPLEPGVHDYSFLVDGEQWVPDPMAPAVDDGFGGLNSRLAVLTASS